MGLVLGDEDKRRSIEVCSFLSPHVLLWVGLYVLAYGILIKELTLGDRSLDLSGINSELYHKHTMQS